jgi:hypothetical protein
MQISQSNAQIELFTVQTFSHPVYRRSLIAHIHENWRDILLFPEATWQDMHNVWAKGEDRSETMRRLEHFRQSMILHLCADAIEGDSRGNTGHKKRLKVEDAPPGGDHGNSSDGLSWDTDTSEDELPSPHTGLRDPATPNPKNTSIITYEEGPPRIVGQRLPPLDNWFIEALLPKSESPVEQEAVKEVTSPSVTPLKRRKGPTSSKAASGPRCWER